MENRATSSGYVGRVSIPAALGLMDSPNAAERLWWPLDGLGTAPNPLMGLELLEVGVLCTIPARPILARKNPTESE